MYQLRLPCLDEHNQTLPLKQVQVFLADGTTPAPLFDLADQPRSNTFITDLSGVIEFRVTTLVTLSFRVLRGLVYSSPLPLYTAGVSPPPPVEISTVGQGLVGTGGSVFTGYALSLDSNDELCLATSDNIDHFGGVIGVATQNGNPGNPVNYISSGYLELPGFTFLPRRPIFLGLGGLITQSPVSSLFIQQLGVAISPTRLMLNIGMPIKRG